MVDLTAVSTSELQTVTKALRADRLRFPLTVLGLRGMGVESEALLALNSLDRTAAMSLLDALCLERARTPRAPQLVWTGPDGRASAARDTAVVLATLFQQARERVLVVGFTFDHADQVLRPLWDAIRRGVTARVFADSGAAELFSTRNWPFGPPFPEVFAFEATAGVFASMHAKCVVVDGRHTLITSANFTDRGQTRNIEVGALIDDVALAESIESQFQETSHFRRLR